MNGLKTVMSWERYGYVPTFYICYGESALAYKDYRCGYHLAFVSCNHMSDLGWTWSWTHRLRAAIHLEAGCKWTQGADPGPVWRTGVWPRHGTCLAYRVVNRIISFSCVLLGPWLFRGDCGLYILCVYEIKLYLTQLKYTIWRKCTNSAEIKSIRIGVPAVSGMLWWSHSD